MLFILKLQINRDNRYWFAKGTVAMEAGAYDSAVNIASGKGTWQDYVGMAMMVAPVGQGKRDLEAEISRRADEAEAARRAEALKAEAAKKEGDGEAYEMSKGICNFNRYYLGC